MDKQAAMENLQILGQMGQQVNPELLNRAMQSLLELSGILEPGESAFNTQTQPAMPPEMMAQAQAMAGGEAPPTPQDGQ